MERSFKVITSSGREKDHVPESTLRAWLSEGHVTTSTLVMPSDSVTWVPLGEALGTDLKLNPSPETEISSSLESPGIRKDSDFAGLEAASLPNSDQLHSDTQKSRIAHHGSWIRASILLIFSFLVSTLIVSRTNSQGTDFAFLLGKYFPIALIVSVLLRYVIPGKPARFQTTVFTCILNITMALTAFHKGYENQANLNRYSNSLENAFNAVLTNKKVDTTVKSQGDSGVMEQLGLAVISQKQDITMWYNNQLKSLNATSLSDNTPIDYPGLIDSRIDLSQKCEDISVDYVNKMKTCLENADANIDQSSMDEDTKAAYKKSFDSSMHELIQTISLLPDYYKLQKSSYLLLKHSKWQYKNNQILFYNTSNLKQFQDMSSEINSIANNVSQYQVKADEMTRNSINSLKAMTQN